VRDGQEPIPWHVDVEVHEYLISRRNIEEALRQAETVLELANRALRAYSIELVPTVHGKYVHEREVQWLLDETRDKEVVDHFMEPIPITLFMKVVIEARRDELVKLQLDPDEDYNISFWDIMDHLQNRYSEIQRVALRPPEGETMDE
jgi:hypothetical protein